jgi:RNA polymerase sigma-70 factor (ECF subfamily)
VHSDADDDTLMAATARGEEAAFRLLVLRWENQVKAFLTHMLGSLEEAEDLAQDTFVKVYRQAGRYRSEGKFQSWLFRIAGNQARSRLRRRKILGWVSFNPGLHDRGDEAPDPLADLEAGNRARLLQAALSELPERQRQALVLHRFQGLKYREAAEVLGTTVPGVESLIQRAMAGLKDRLAGKVELS